MKLSIIIPSVPKPSLSNLLQSLKGQPYNEIIISMENSPSKSRNYGAKRASGDILCFIDDDVIVAPDFIAQGLAAMGDSIDYGQSRVVGGIENSEEKFIGAAIWFRKYVFDDLNGFDEAYQFANEDIDIHIRAQEKKYAYGFFENSLCFHPGRGTFEKLVEGNKILEKKHPQVYADLKKELR